MRSLLPFTVFALVGLAMNAQAREVQVPKSSAPALFNALRAAFPEASQGFNHSIHVFVDSLDCQSNEDEYRCAGQTIEGQPLLLEGGNPVPQEADVNQRLDALWAAMKLAEIPMKSGKGYSHVELKFLGCSRTTPQDGDDVYECGYEVQK